MTQNKFFESFSLLKGPIASLLLALFCLTLVPASPVLTSTQSGPIQHWLTHQHDHLIDVVCQPCKHSTETAGNALAVILALFPAVETVGNPNRLFLPAVAPLLPYYLVYTETTTSRL